MAHTDHRRPRVYLADACLALGVLVLDRITKRWAEGALTQPRDLWPGVLGLRLTENTGAAFGLFSGGTWVLTLVTALLIAGVAVWYLRAPGRGRLVRLGQAAVIAGGLSNLYDRIAWGRVVDFIEPLFVRFAIFNVADIAVVAGALAMAVGLLRSEG